MRNNTGRGVQPTNPKTKRKGVRDATWREVVLITISIQKRAQNKTMQQLAACFYCRPTIKLGGWLWDYSSQVFVSPTHWTGEGTLVCQPDNAATCEPRLPYDSQESRLIGWIRRTPWCRVGFGVVFLGFENGEP